MKFSKKKLEKSQIAIEAQVAAEDVGKYRAEAIEGLAKDLRLEGFRPGHIPPSLAEKHLGEGTVLKEMARIAITETWNTIVRQENLDVIGEPAVEVLKLAPGNPLEFRIQVAVLPEVELPDYREIAKQSSRRKVAVGQKEVDEALEWLRKSRKTKDGVTPEETNEFAQSVGNFPDVASLRQSIQEGLQHEKEMQEKDRLRQEIIEKVAEQTKIEAPDVLVVREKQVLLSRLKQDMANILQTSFEEYLQKAGKTEQELLDSLAKEAEQRVKRFLVVREIAKKEALGPTQQEVEQEANELLKHYATAQKDLDPQKLREYTEGVLRHEKTLQFLEQFAQS